MTEQQERDEIRELAISSPFTYRQWQHARDILGERWGDARPTVVELTLKTGQTPDGAAQRIVDALSGVVVCDARAAACRCVKPHGHLEAGDPVHACHPDRCTGQWEGVMDTPTFRCVVFPRAVGGPPRPWEFE